MNQSISLEPVHKKEDRPKNLVHPLDPIFKPKTVAVIGATEKEGSVGRTILWNLLSSPFGGTVFPVNPNRSSVLGIKAYPDIASVPEPVDLAVVVTPAGMIPGLIGQCSDVGVKGAIVISAGFKELGPEGAELERQILEQARRSNIRIIGPNCLGLMNPLSGLNATFAANMAKLGTVGFISQSGALCTAILDWSHQHMVGFSAFVSIGSMLDVGWGDLIDYLGNDPRTKSIVIYMESVGDARSFLSAAREVALRKPIIVIKAGRTEAAAKAAASHTGALTGSDEVLHAAFRRCGVLRVNNISDLFYLAEVLSKQPVPKGPRLTILTNAGGPGVLATDTLIGEGGQLAELSEETMARLNDLLPPHWSRNNPVDILGDADAGRYAKSLEIAAEDPNSDGLLVILTPQAMTKATQTAEDLKEQAKKLRKPVLASWMGGAEVAAGISILEGAGIPTFPYPDKAASVWNLMWRYGYNLRGIYETPAMLVDAGDDHERIAAVDGILRQVRESGRTLLTEYESKQLLAAYEIPTVETRIASSGEEAASIAAELGFPVVVKLHSETITHKMDVGGVQLNLKSAEGVRMAYEAIATSVNEKAGPGHFLGVTVQRMAKLDGYELIIGSSVDPQFGPVLLFGTGGSLVEIFKDRALGLPPLNTTLARRMMEQTTIYKALKGVRGRKSVDLEALEQLLVRFSHLVASHPVIKELDINPLLVSETQIQALDARVVIHGKEVPSSAFPQLAIRPYPIEYVGQIQTRSGETMTIRPIRPEDEPLIVKFHQNLSEDTVYSRYFHAMSLSQRTAHERLFKICFIDYSRQVVLVVETKDPETGKPEIVGVGRLNRFETPERAEFAIMVVDQYQKRGIGRAILHRLIEIAPSEGIQRIHGMVLPENVGMLNVCKSLGFKLEPNHDDHVVDVVIDLNHRGQ